MTTVKTLLGQCIILLGIFVCYVHPWDEKSGDINCEYFPFYAACRGSMSKRIPRNEADDNKVDKNWTPLEKRLWISLLNILDDDDDYYYESGEGPKDWNAIVDMHQAQLKDHLLAEKDKTQNDN